MQVRGCYKRITAHHGKITGKKHNMKNLVFIFLVLISFKSNAQNYGDSSITLTVLQKNCYWIGQYIKTSFAWTERNAPSQMKDFVGSGNNPDSIIGSVTFKAKYLLGGLDALISQPLQVAYADYRSIVLNAPTISGYTSLTTQINTIASGSGAQKNTAQWLKDRYTALVSVFDAQYQDQKNQVITWSKQ